MEEIAADGSSGSRAQRRDRVALAVLAVPCMLISVNSNLLNLALAADLRPSTTQLLWISDRWLADRFGRRRLLLIGAAVFGSASIGAAFSGSRPP